MVHHISRGTIVRSTDALGSLKLNIMVHSRPWVLSGTPSLLLFPLFQVHSLYLPWSGYSRSSVTKRCKPVETKMRSTTLVLAAVFSTFLSVAAAVPHELRGARIHQRAQDIADEYDYIIVGAGTAGLTVADRLSADGKCKSHPGPLILKPAIDPAQSQRPGHRVLPRR